MGRDRECGIGAVLSSIHHSLWVFWPFPFEPNSMWLRLIKGNTVLKRMGRMPILFSLWLLFHHFSTFSWYAFGSKIGILFVFGGCHVGGVISFEAFPHLFYLSYRHYILISRFALCSLSKISISVT